MKMRKIIAVLAAVLMLCAIVPMGVFAAPGDVIIDADFNDGMDGFNNFSAVDGALVLDGTSADWANAYAYANAIQPNTKYVVTFCAKADTDKALSFKINNGWSGTDVQESANITTEWAEYELVLTTTSALNSPIFTIQTGTYANQGTVYYIDWVKVVEYKEPVVPGKVVNGDFETGDLSGWTAHQSTVISTGAAHTGSYGANLKGNGGWGGMLNQDVTVEAGKTYEVSLWYKVNSNGVNIQIKDGGTSGANLASDWVTKTTWTQAAWTVIPTTNIICFNFCGGGNSIAEDVYVDDIVIKELKDPSDDGFIVNGDFEIGSATPWTTYSGTAVDAVAAKDGDYGLYIKNPTGGWGGTAYQDFAVEVGKTYEVTMDAKAIAGGQNIQIQNPVGGANAASTWFTKTEWTTLTFEFTATADSVRINICGGGTGANEEIYVDNIKVKELIDPSFDGYITNGDFETGDLYPWQRIWDTQVNASIIDGGLDSAYAVEVSAANGKTWGQLRQKITVVPNTDYIATVWAKNSVGMSLLIKDGDDTTDINNVGAEAGDEWVQITNKFNSGDYTSVLVGVMCNTDTASGIFDNLSVAVAPAHVCEFVGEITEEATCTLTGTMTYSCTCGEGTYTEEIPAYHDGNLTHVEAKEAIDCLNPGNIEYYYCPWCSEYFADAYAGEYLNPWYIQITVECARPEDAADCAIVPCTVCGNDTYGYGDHDVVLCQGGVCGKCGDTIEGYGCANYDTPACEDGVCYYCGGPVAGYGHENGAWADCLEGECTHGCGLTYPATAEHNDTDADGWCDNCWSHLNHDTDPCYGGECSVCWELIAPTHTATHVEAKDATCYENGNVEYWYCEICGQAWLDAEMTIVTNLKSVVTPMDHGTITHVEAKDATCDVNGNIEYWYCEACGQAWLDAECTLNTNLKSVVVAAPGHSYNYECDRYCNECGEETNPRANHSIIAVDAVDATCYENGNVAYWYCEYCENVWSDADLRYQTNFKSVVIPAAHKIVAVDAVDATCTTNGNIAYWYCEADDCGLVWADEDLTQVTNHKNVVIAASCRYNAVYTPAQAATCDEPGYEEHWYCATCDVYYTDADCTIVTNAKNLVIPVSHNVLHVEAKDATCTENGNIEYWYCDACGAAWLDELCHQNTNLKSIVIPAAHSYAHDFDGTCENCEDAEGIREVELPIVTIGVSASEDVNGLAVSFKMDVVGMTVVNNTVAVYADATLGGYKLVSMGAIVSNGADTKTVHAKYLYDLEADSAQFAVRVINIPEGKGDVTITYTSYFEIEIEAGITAIVYGDAVNGTYNGALAAANA